MSRVDENFYRTGQVTVLGNDGRIVRQPHATQDTVKQTSDVITWPVGNRQSVHLTVLGSPTGFRANYYAGMRLVDTATTPNEGFIQLFTCGLAWASPSGGYDYDQRFPYAWWTATTSRVFPCYRVPSMLSHYQSQENNAMHGISFVPTRSQQALGKVQITIAGTWGAFQDFSIARLAHIETNSASLTIFTGLGSNPDFNITLGDTVWIDYFDSYIYLGYSPHFLHQLELVKPTCTRSGVTLPLYRAIRSTGITSQNSPGLTVISSRLNDVFVTIEYSKGTALGSCHTVPAVIEWPSLNGYRQGYNGGRDYGPLVVDSSVSTLVMTDNGFNINNIYDRHFQVWKKPYQTPGRPTSGITNRTLSNSYGFFNNRQWVVTNASIKIVYEPSGRIIVVCHAGGVHNSALPHVVTRVHTQFITILTTPTNISQIWTFGLPSGNNIILGITSDASCITTLIATTVPGAGFA